MSVDKNMPILIMDDDKTMLRVIRHLLKQIGVGNVDEANDGRMALRKLRDMNAASSSLVNNDIVKPSNAATLRTNLLSVLGAF